MSSVKICFEEMIREAQDSFCNAIEAADGKASSTDEALGRNCKVILLKRVTKNSWRGVLNECVEAENWLREKQQQQDSLPKYANPLLLSPEIRRKAEAVDRICKPIMRKRRPAKPATPQTPATPPPHLHRVVSSNNLRGMLVSNANVNANENAGDSSSQVPPASSEPMETDKSENTGSAA